MSCFHFRPAIGPSAHFSIRYFYSARTGQRMKSGMKVQFHNVCTVHELFIWKNIATQFILVHLHNKPVGHLQPVRRHDVSTLRPARTNLGTNLETNF